MILRYFYSLLKGLNMLSENERRLQLQGAIPKESFESLGALALNVSQIRQDLDHWLPGIKAMLAQVHAAVHALSEDREAEIRANAKCCDGVRVVPEPVPQTEQVGEAPKGNPLGLPPDWNVKCLDEQMGALIKQVDRLDERVGSLGRRLTGVEQLELARCMKNMSDRIRVVEDQIGRVDRFIEQLGRITK